MLLSVDLEVALRGLRSRLPSRPPADASFPFDVEYADDTDLISSTCSILDEIGRITSACLAEWSRRSVFRHADRIDEEWKMTLKLVSLPSDAEDSACRKQTVYTRRLPEVVDSVAKATEDQPATSAEVLRVV